MVVVHRQKKSCFLSVPGTSSDMHASGVICETPATKYISTVSQKSGIHCLSILVLLLAMTEWGEGSSFEAETRSRGFVGEH